MSTFRFAARDFLGRVKSYFLVSKEDATAAQTVTVREPGHFIFVCDASGSMWGQMAALRSFVVKLVTLEEFRGVALYVSVVSFSSAGDLVVHAARVAIDEFMAPNSKPLAEVQNLDVRGLTCISQGLKAVPNLLGSELTAVVLLSDGFANDQSPGAEKREIDNIVEDLRKRANVFVNTISLGTWADFKLLAYIANACSGTCFQAPTVKEVYNVLHETTSLITGSTAPAMSVPMNGADYAVFMSRSGGKILGSRSDMLVRGLRAEDDRVIYRYRKVEEAEYNASTAPICGETADVTPILAYAKAQLSEGFVNGAKYALVATRDETLLLAHARALVNTEIAAMSADIENAAINGIPASHVTSATYGLPNADKLSVLGVLSILSDYVSDVQVDMVALRDGYKKRGVRRLAGTRTEDGKFIPFPYKLAPREPSQFRQVSSFDFNQNNATCNMLVTEAAKLVDADGNPVTEKDTAGVKLDLYAPRYYNLVGDGSLNVGRLCVRIGNKRLFRALVAAKVLPEGTFDAAATYEIVLEGRPLIAYDVTFTPSMFDDVFARAARMKMLASILKASMKSQSAEYTPEQVEALKAKGVSKSGNFSPPTINEYADIKQALSDGIIDTRLSYKVDFGTKDILNLGEFYSANAYLQRRFTLTRGGEAEKKPTFDMRWDADVSYGIKPVGPKLTVGPVDDVQYPLFLDFLGLAQNGLVEITLRDAGLSDEDVKGFMEALRGTVSQDDAVERFADAQKAVERGYKRLFRDTVSPFVFYVGATGLMPDEFNARAMTAEQVKQKYPKLKIGSSEAEGTFYEVGDTVLCIYVEAEYFSTGKVPQVEAEEAA